jgi:hypothetical protein
MMEMGNQWFPGNRVYGSICQSQPLCPVLEGFGFYAPTTALWAKA